MRNTPAGAVEARTMVGEENQFSLDVPAEPSSIRTARLFAAAIARHFGSDEDVVEDVKLAISEACTNAVKAHQVAGRDQPVSLRATAGPAQVTFEISDSGAGFTPVPTDPLVTPPAGLYEGSLGLTLIRSLFPHAEIVANDDRGMTVRFAVDIDPDPTEPLEG